MRGGVDINEIQSWTELYKILLGIAEVVGSNPTIGPFIRLEITSISLHQLSCFGPVPLKRAQHSG